MSRNAAFVNPADQMAEIRVHSKGSVILSRINYCHLERVLTARLRRDTVRGDATRVGIFGLRFD